MSLKRDEYFAIEDKNGKLRSWSYRGGGIMLDRKREGLSACCGEIGRVVRVKVKIVKVEKETPTNGPKYDSQTTRG
jgi:hypothetical protein